MDGVLKTRQLTAEYLREVLHYNADTGIFTWLKPRRKVRVGDRAGIIDPRGYVLIGIDQVRYWAHRLAWLYVYGEFPSDQLDHRNANKSDNRIANLRLANRSLNEGNKGRSRRNTSGVKGVSWHAASQKWIAQIHRDGAPRYLGLFVDKDAAAAAYAKAAVEHFGEFARLS
jgi:hypothetical protein